MCIGQLKFINIKNGIDKRRALIGILVNKYDYDETNTIIDIINSRFDKENINDNYQRITVASEFADNIECLIDVISINSISIYSYIVSTFNNVNYKI